MYVDHIKGCSMIYYTQIGTILDRHAYSKRIFTKEMIKLSSESETLFKSSGHHFLSRQNSSSTGKRF